MQKVAVGENAADVTFDGVSKIYGTNSIAVDNISFNVKAGNLVTLLGPSGCGKTTTLRMIAGLEAVTKGKIFIGGEDVTDQPASERDVSMVFQSYALFPHKTVLQNVGYGLEMQGKPEDERDRTAMEKIDAVGLTGFENQFPNQLSGGMQQRVGLARALATDSDIMLMDEAFSALDPLIRSDMQKQLLDLQSELKKTIVFITHDLDESLRLGDHIGILNAGKLVQVGTPVDIIMNPADDYVKAFVKDVNRTKVIKAKIIMKSVNESNDIDKSNLIKVNEDQFIEEFLPQIVCSNSNCEVVDKSGNVKGYISNRELQTSLTKS